MIRPAGFDAPVWDPSWLIADDARAQRNAPAPSRIPATPHALSDTQRHELRKLHQRQARRRTVTVARTIGTALGVAFLVVWSAVWFAFI